MRRYNYTWQAEIYSGGKKIAEYSQTHDTLEAAKDMLREIRGYEKNTAARIYKNEIANYKNAKSIIIYERGLRAMA